MELNRLKSLLPHLYDHCIRHVERREYTDQVLVGLVGVGLSNKYDSDDDHWFYISEYLNEVISDAENMDRLVLCDYTAETLVSYLDKGYTSRFLYLLDDALNNIHKGLLRQPPFAIFGPSVNDVVQACPKNTKLDELYCVVYTWKKEVGADYDVMLIESFESILKRALV